MLAFLKNNARAKKQALVIEQVAASFGQNLACYVVDDHYLKAGMSRFRVDGTPTILCLHHGVEVDRLMGEADTETLGQFICDCVESHRMSA